MIEADGNLFSAFHKQFVARPNAPLLVTDQDKVYRYSDIDEASARLANYLTELGVAPGDRVSVHIEKSPVALSLYLACLRAGFVYHPLNSAYQARELEYFFRDAEPRIIICDGAKRDAIAPLAEAANVAYLETLDADGGGSLVDKAKTCAATFSTLPRNGDELAALLYSSGTTGQPKGIMLTHTNLLSNASALVDAWRFSANDRLLHALPIFHVHGLFVALGCVLLSGASMRWLPKFDVEKSILYLDECSVMMGVPTYYIRLLASDRFDSKLAQTLRLFVSGSAPLQEETFHAFEARTGQQVLERYGMTETNMNTTNPLQGERKAGSVGLALPGVTVRVVDPSNRQVAAGVVGDVQVKGDNVFKGYWRRAQKTAEDFTEDGFFNTGDKGCLDTDGYLTIVGRAKDLIITGGLNVYPREIERVIDDLPEVRESAVIGVPHPDFGEGIVAVVVPHGGHHPNELSIIEALKTQIARFKVPKRVMIVETLPRNTMGKIQKNRLREEYHALLQG